MTPSFNPLNKEKIMAENTKGLEGQVKEQKFEEGINEIRDDLVDDDSTLWSTLVDSFGISENTAENIITEMISTLEKELSKLDITLTLKEVG
ncbi:MAG: hypothetical protein HQ539_02660 [Parcubacteria group bacterium]|nr:hypothetical protein [Parcubacteria group bacterium]